MPSLRREHPAGAVHEPVVVPVSSLPTGASAGAVTEGETGRVRLTAWVHGHVQGVGMRWWIRSRALERGLVGWARNTDDGRVEVVAEGPADRTREFLNVLRQTGGGRPGRVTDVTERWSHPQGDLSGFRER